MIPFIPQGPSVVLAYADDSTDQSITVTTGAYGVPNCLLVVNPDAANVIAFSYSFNSLDTNASVPNSGANGIGTIVGPRSQVQIQINSTYQTGNLYLSAAGVSGSGAVYVTPGVITR
jgi:hypothetical protein